MHGIRYKWYLIENYDDDDTNGDNDDNDDDNEYGEGQWIRWRRHTGTIGSELNLGLRSG